jgi:hypothetical protein
MTTNRLRIGPIINRRHAISEANRPTKFEEPPGFFAYRLGQAEQNELPMN